LILETLRVGRASTMLPSMARSNSESIALCVSVIVKAEEINSKGREVVKTEMRLTR
jgi:hypothetical protein